MFEIDLRLTGWREVQAALKPELYKKTMNRTLNELGAKMRTAAVKNVRAVYNVKAGTIKRYLTVERSRYSNMRYRLKVRGSTLNIAEFGARMTRRGITVRVKKAGGRKLIRGSFMVNGRAMRRIPGTQMTRSKYAKYSKRLGRLWKREQIRGIYGLSVPQMFNEATLKEAFEIIQHEYFTVYDRNWSYYLGRVKR